MQLGCTLEQLPMCSHNQFIVLLFAYGIIIRQCKSCDRIEIKTEGWIDVETISKVFGFELLEKLAEKNDDVAKALAYPH